MKICTTCGTRFPEDVMMCPNDGTPLFASFSGGGPDIPAEANASDTQAQDNETANPMAAAAAMAVGGGVTASPLLPSQGLPETEEDKEAALRAAEEEIRKLQSGGHKSLSRSGDQSAAPVSADVIQEAATSNDLQAQAADLMAQAAAVVDADPSIDIPSLEPLSESDLQEDGINSADYPSVEPMSAAPIDDGMDHAAQDHINTPPQGNVVISPDATDGSLLDMIDETMAHAPAPLESASMGGDPISLDTHQPDLPKPVSLPTPVPAAPVKKGAPIAVLAIVALVVLAALGAVGYFFILPMMSS